MVAVLLKVYPLKNETKRNEKGAASPCPGMDRPQNQLGFLGRTFQKEGIKILQRDENTAAGANFWKWNR